MTAVVIGIGNPDRRDDGIGPAVAAAVAAECSAGVRVLSCPAEPTAILDAWAGADLAVIVDAVAGPDRAAGQVRRCTLGDVAPGAGLSSHDLSLASTYELGRVLERAPARVVVISVAAADFGHGTGLSPAVAAAVPRAAAAVLAELAGLAGEVEEPAHQQP